jgi:hypothetical protein
MSKKSLISALETIRRDCRAWLDGECDSLKHNELLLGFEDFINQVLGEKHDENHAEDEDLIAYKEIALHALRDTQISYDACEDIGKNLRGYSIS